MDFSTIQRKMKAKDGSGYKNAREIYADVRLIFNNAMKYNDKDHDVHKMAKFLLGEFEEKWSHLSPKVTKLENELSKEAHENLNKKLAQEATYANMTRKLSDELSEADQALTNLKSTMIAKCRKLSSMEKPLLAADISKLSHDNLRKALEIVNESNPDFKVNMEDVTLDLDSQSNYTLWRLFMFVKNALELQDASSGITHVDNIEEKEAITRADNIEEEKKSDFKRRRMM
ncbi:transcription factor GTE1-like [Vicia villosa]|uniref:transcription factor GTE1-like n=1 Tax=Vicia villosa TaxID=3911 RepID=UPI00273A8A44|nr:transcription factor GTE1-like [Vicia villosa]